MKNYEEPVELQKAIHLFYLASHGDHASKPSKKGTCNTIQLDWRYRIVQPRISSNKGTTPI